MGHEHVVYDTDKHFIIDSQTREVKNYTETKKVIFQYDHNSERFTFEIPKLIDGHDMTKCNSVQVHYINIEQNTSNSNSGIYEIDDLKEKDDDPETLTCSWLISRNVTQFVGKLNFILRFACVSEDGSVDYVWNTAIHSRVSVSNSISNTEEITEEYADILENWKKELTELGTDYNNISNAPIKYVKSPDSNGNQIIIRDLDSGTYILDGAFYLFKTDTASQAANFKWGFPVVIGKTADKTYVQVLYPPRNTIQYVEITDDGFYQNNVSLDVKEEDILNIVQ